VAGGDDARSRFRPDIEGLRGVAVLMVLVFHAGVSVLPGGFAGVDVFFVISGFLITGLLVREVELSGRVRLLAFYARRAKRLLPAASVVLLAAGLLTWAVLPRIRWAETAGDLIASAVYVVNWRLADRSVDYLAEDSVASPVQHYRSLAVEEQFYVAWPLLIVLGAWLVRRSGAHVRRVLGVLLAGVVVASFTWSLHLTETSPETAYFVSTTRLWELGLGGLVALAAPLLQRLTATSATLLAWCGLLAVLASTVVLGPGTAWPGSAALLPTLGAAALIAGGTRARPAGPARWLGSGPMRWVGGMSYSLYLWHWPLLIAAAAWWGRLSVWQGLAVAAFSFAPSWLTRTLVENPVRRTPVLARVPAGLAVGLACTLVGVVSGTALLQGVERSIEVAEPAQAVGADALAAEPQPSASSPAVPGTPPTSTAEPATPSSDPALAGPDVSRLDLEPESITPDPLTATQDVPSLYGRGCQTEVGSAQVIRCDAGDPDGDRVVAAVGDSKVAQWGDVLDEVARAQGWQLRLYVRAACPWTAATVDADDPSCTRWGAAVRERLLGDERPDVVLVSGVKSTAVDANGDRDAKAMAEGYVAYWSDLASVGVPVIALADTPQPGRLSVFACVADHHDDVSACTFERNSGSGTGPLGAAVARVPTSRMVDMNDWICPVERCPPVIGNVLVYRQGSHLTNTYAQTLVEPLRARLAAVVEAGDAMAPGEPMRPDEIR